MANLTLYGLPISSFVRKVRLALHFKKIDYQLLPVIPRSAEQPAEFKANSPLGKIPLLRINDDYLADSSVMCAWLEREYPQTPLLPADNLAAAQALWLEEYADSVMTQVISGHLFAEQVLATPMFKRPANQADIDTALSTEIPEIFDYLSRLLQSDYLMGDKLTLADIAVGGHFLTLEHCGYHCDAERWPKIADYRTRLLADTLFSSHLAEEQQLLANLIR